MKFDEKLARELQKAYNLPEQRIKNWRGRGSIPDKYAQEGYREPEKVKESAKTQRLRAIMKMREIAYTNFRAFEAHPNYTSSTQRAADVKKGRPFERDEVNKLASEIAELRNACAAAIAMPTTGNFRTLLQDKRLHPTKIIENKLYQKAIEARGVAPLLPSEKAQVINSIKLLKTKLQF